MSQKAKRRAMSQRSVVVCLKGQRPEKMPTKRRGARKTNAKAWNFITAQAHPVILASPCEVRFGLDSLTMFLVGMIAWAMAFVFVEERR